MTTNDYQAPASNWVLIVARFSGPFLAPTSILVLEPATAEDYTHSRPQLARSGWQHLNPAGYEKGAFPLARRGAVDVVDNRYVRRFTTGNTSFWLAPPSQASPLWLSSSQSRQALVCVAAPGSFTATPAPGMNALHTAVREGNVIGALCQVRVNALTPDSGP